jgi:dihydropteroate synthase
MPAASATSHEARGARLATLWTADRPLVMGILNCTPDSFSDGGRFVAPESALAHAESLLADGADIVDIGGESTRPNAIPPPADEELRRVLPIVEALRARHPEARISVDTRTAVVAAAALDAGADIVNDVSGGDDPRLLAITAEAEAAIVLMHMRGQPRTMQEETRYTHVVAEVHEDLRRRAQRACQAGVADHLIWLDPGIGFGKDDAGNLALLAALPELASLAHPVLVGPSRKSFIGRLTGAAVGDRLAGSLAAVLPLLDLPRAVVRVHDPAPFRQFLTIALALSRGAE